MSERTMEALDRLREIARIIEAVDDRCMAVDGPVTPTRLEMTDDELRRIYELATSEPGGEGECEAPGFLGLEGAPTFFELREMAAGELEDTQVPDGIAARREYEAAVRRAADAIRSYGGGAPEEVARVVLGSVWPRGEHATPAALLSEREGKAWKALTYAFDAICPMLTWEEPMQAARLIVEQYRKAEALATEAAQGEDDFNPLTVSASQPSPSSARKERVMTRSSQTEYERVAGVLEACADAEKRLGGHPYRAKIMRRSAELLRRAHALLRTSRGEAEPDAYMVTASRYRDGGGVERTHEWLFLGSAECEEHVEWLRRPQSRWRVVRVTPLYAARRGEGGE